MMNKILIIGMMFLMMGSLSAQTKNEESMKDRIKTLISEMTLEEKASLCSGRDDWSTNTEAYFFRLPCF